MVSTAAGKPPVRTRTADRDGLVIYCTFNAPEERPVREHAEYHVYPEVQAVGTVLTSTGKEERNAVSDPRGEWGAAAQASPP